MFQRALLRFLLTTFLLTAGLSGSVRAAIVINEIHYNSDVKTEPVEFIELTNTGGAAVDLSGWQLTDAVTYTFPGGTTIAPADFVVIAANPAAVQTKWGVSGVLGPWSGKLSNEGEKIELRDGAGTKVNEVDYLPGFPWPTSPDGDGTSLELINPAFDNSLPGNWRPSGGFTSATLVTLIDEESDWDYRKGTSEASSPIGDWRLSGFVEDASWLPGAAPIGYGTSAVVTDLADMKNAYSTVYLRKTFNVTDPSQLHSLSIQAMFDDGINVWINGHLVLRNNTPSDNPLFNEFASTNPADDSSYREFALPDPAGYLVAGANVIAVQLLNRSLNSSDAVFDCRLLNTFSHAPTPGDPNSSFTATAPPLLDELTHTPQQPTAGQPVTITVKAAAPSGITAVTLKYQIVEPGAYIRVSDPEWLTNWTADLPMHDDGIDGDAVAGDGIYSIVIPGSVQVHRRLVRYRIGVSAGNGIALAAPFADDAQYNFAYFCTNGNPAWTAKIDPANNTSDPAKKTPVTYDATVMNSLPSLQLITRQQDVINCQYNSAFNTNVYQFEGAVVYNGEVYDHVHYRIRGHGSTYRTGKNKWKFKFNRAHWLRMRDNYGNLYPSPWKILVVSTGTNTWWDMSQSTEGMLINEPLSMRLHELAGVPASKTTMFQYRIIEDAQESSPTDQYASDFWGIYIAIEYPDSRFLGDRDLPDGNLYSIASSAADVYNQGDDAVTDASDIKAFSNSTTGYIRTSPSHQPTSWWRQHVNLDDYYRSKAIDDATDNADRQGPTSDTAFGNNFILYHQPVTDQWWVLPWDLDRSFEYGRAHDWPTPPAKPVIAGSVPPAFRNEQERFYFMFDDPDLWVEYQNTAREMQDLLLNMDEGGRLVDELAGFITTSSGGHTLVEANRAQWEYHSRVVATGRQGKFYANNPALNALGGQNFPALVEYWKRFISPASVEALMPPITTAPFHYGGKLVSTNTSDADIPSTPTLAYIGSAGFPANDLRFECGSFADPQGSGTFAAMKWRIGEISDKASPGFDPNKPQHYEVEPLWDSGELTAFGNRITVPPASLKVGHVYRARVKMKDSSGRWSHWSAPVQFTLGAPSNSAALVNSLRLTEMLFDPPLGDAYEFAELRNDGATTIDLTGVTFTNGITFTFPTSSTLAPAAYLLLTRASNLTTFRAYYNVPASVALYVYSGKLDNQGERVTLKTLAGGDTIFDLTFDNSRGWVIPPQTGGHSMVPKPAALAGEPDGSLDFGGNWTASAFIKGSPGRDEPAVPPSPVLNEFNAHTDPAPPADSDDWIEIHNPTASPITLNSDWYLSDDTEDLKKYAFGNVTVPAGGFYQLDELTGFHPNSTTGFGLNKAGERILLSYLPGTAQDRIVDSVRFEGQENGPTTGRYPNGNPWWQVMNATQGVSNAAPIPHPVISEVMYHPDDDTTATEYVRIFNPLAQPVDLWTNDGAILPWRISGGIDYTFPTSATLPAFEYAFVVAFSPSDSARVAAFKAKYGITEPVRFFGPYTGEMSNHLARLSLEKPQGGDAPDPPSLVNWIVVDELIYFDQSPFPPAADGTGFSLQRLSNAQAGMDPANWVARLPNLGPAPQSAAQNHWRDYGDPKY